MVEIVACFMNSGMKPLCFSLFAITRNDSFRLDPIQFSLKNTAIYPFGSLDLFWSIVFKTLFKSNMVQSGLLFRFASLSFISKASFLYTQYFKGLDGMVLTAVFQRTPFLIAF